MPESERTLFETQVGKESTWGTQVASTSKLMTLESFEINPIDETKLLRTQRGSLSRHFISALTKVGGEATFGGFAAFEDIHYYLEGMFGEVTPSGADPYTYAGNAPLGTKPTLREQTVIHGSADYVKALAGGIVNELKISGKYSEEVKIGGSMLGMQVKTDALESLSDRTVNPIMGDMLTLYIDDFGGTIGTTEVAALAYAFELTLKAGFAPKYHLGNLAPDGYKVDVYEGSLKMVLELAATTYTYLTEVLSTTAVWDKLVRLSFANAGDETLVLDFAGAAEKRPKLWTDEDGVATLEFELTDHYESGLGNWFKYTGDNNLSALP